MSSICKDPMTSYLQGLGYNVVRHPNASINPLDLIGHQGNSTTYLGGLDKLITNPPSSPVPTKLNVPAADINGKSTNNISASIAANILGNLVGAMGGNLGVNLSYTDADNLQFDFVDVYNDWAAPLDIGNYLRSGIVDSGNPVLQQYVLGNGELYVITKTAKSDKFTVTYSKDNGEGAEVDVPVLQGIAGGNLTVKASQSNASSVTFQGQQQLIFGFQCYQVGLEDGKLSVFSSDPGDVPLVYSLQSTHVTPPSILRPRGLLYLNMPLVPAAAKQPSKPVAPAKRPAKAKPSRRAKG